MEHYYSDNEIELKSLQTRKESLIDEYNRFVAFERDKEFDMDYFYQKAIVDEDNNQAMEMSPELCEIREEQRRLFFKMQDERQEFMYSMKQKLNNRIDDIDNEIKELTRERENG